MAHVKGDHYDCDPDECFGAKIRHIRNNGGLPVAFGSGRSPATDMTSQELFHNSTMAEEQRKMAKMNEGQEIMKLPKRKELI